jgi:Dyp-type peroxidase family
MNDGSFMVFRKLEQDVARWNEFLFERSKALGIKPGLLGARLMGRWKSGCPIQLSPEVDDTALGKDEHRNNSFFFDNAVGSNPSEKCPVGAHIRKTFPRNDASSPANRNTIDQSRILRRGIPYGAELDADPNGKRGLLFVCYQSNISLGFRLIQRFWANEPGFRLKGAGLDAIIGQSNDMKEVDMVGISPLDLKSPLKMEGINRFVIPKGGEYFFMPSMTALRTTLSTVKAGV